MKYLLVTIVLLPILLVVTAVVILNTERAQRWLFRHGIELLSEKLHTEVRADSISVSPRLGTFVLYGLEIDDLSKEHMFHADTIGVGVNVMSLFDRKVVVTDIKLNGVDALLYKEHKDSAANFQFVAEAFKKKDKKKTEEKEKKKKMELLLDVERLDISRMHVKWDVRDKQRKNIGKPKRGAFDTNHLDMNLDMVAKLHSRGKDSVEVNIKEFRAADKGSGLIVKSMTANAGIGKNAVCIDTLCIDLQHTNIKTGGITLLHSKNPDTGETALTIQPFHLSADVLLQDIAKPFAPALSDFTTPLTLGVDILGTKDKIKFNNIHITTPDKRIRLTARGNMQGFATHHKEDLQLHFRNIKLKAVNGVKEQIIKHFSKKIRMKMVRQIHAIGDIRFNGILDIVYKRQHIAGTMLTKFGNVNANFWLDARTHFMTGTMRTDSFELGKVMNIERLGPVRASASYSFNISSKHPTGKSNPHGRLPQGTLSAEVHQAKYRFIHFKNIYAEMESDGSVATGTITVPQKQIDLVFDFAYTQTDTEQSLKFKPSLKRHKGSAFDKAINKVSAFFKNVFGKKEHKEDPDTTTKPKKNFFKRLFGKKEKKE